MSSGSNQGGLQPCLDARGVKTMSRKVVVRLATDTANPLDDRLTTPDRCQTGKDSRWTFSLLGPDSSFLKKGSMLRTTISRALCPPTQDRQRLSRSKFSQILGWAKAVLAMPDSPIRHARRFVAAARRAAHGAGNPYRLMEAGESGFDPARGCETLGQHLLGTVGIQAETAGSFVSRSAGHVRARQSGDQAHRCAHHRG